MDSVLVRTTGNSLSIDDIMQWNIGTKSGRPLNGQFDFSFQTLQTAHFCYENEGRIETTKL
jgi:hypothetical protein